MYNVEIAHRVDTTFGASPCNLVDCHIRKVRHLVQVLKSLLHNLNRYMVKVSWSKTSFENQIQRQLFIYKFGTFWCHMNNWKSLLLQNHFQSFIENNKKENISQAIFLIAMLLLYEVWSMELVRKTPPQIKNNNNWLSSTIFFE